MRRTVAVTVALLLAAPVEAGIQFGFGSNAQEEQQQQGRQEEQEILAYLKDRVRQVYRGVFNPDDPLWGPLTREWSEYEVIEPVSMNDVPELRLVHKSDIVRGGPSLSEQWLDSELPVFVKTFYVRMESFDNFFSLNKTPEEYKAEVLRFLNEYEAHLDDDFWMAAELYVNHFAPYSRAPKSEIKKKILERKINTDEYYRFNKWRSERLLRWDGDKYERGVERKMMSHIAGLARQALSGELPTVNQQIEQQQQASQDEVKDFYRAYEQHVIDFLASEITKNTEGLRPRPDVHTEIFDEHMNRINRRLLDSMKRFLRYYPEDKSLQRDTARLEDELSKKPPKILWHEEVWNREKTTFQTWPEMLLRVKMEWIARTTSSPEEYVSELTRFLEDFERNIDNEMWVMGQLYYTKHLYTPTTAKLAEFVEREIAPLSAPIGDKYLDPLRVGIKQIKQSLKSRPSPIKYIAGGEVPEYVRLSLDYQPHPVGTAISKVRDRIVNHPSTLSLSGKIADVQKRKARARSAGKLARTKNLVAQYIKDNTPERPLTKLEHLFFFRLTYAAEKEGINTYEDYEAELKAIVRDFSSNTVSVSARDRAIMGIANARADLARGKTVVLTGHELTAVGDMMYELKGYAYKRLLTQASLALRRKGDRNEPDLQALARNTGDFLRQITSYGSATYVSARRLTPEEYEAWKNSK